MSGTHQFSVHKMVFRFLLLLHQCRHASSEMFLNLKLAIAKKVECRKNAIAL